MWLVLFLFWEKEVEFLSIDILSNFLLVCLEVENMPLSGPGITQKI